MQLLDFNLPPFARVVWASGKIKENWEPRLQKAQNVFHVMEKQSVVHGLRKCTTEHISPDNFLRRMQELSRQGLTFSPMQAVGSYTGFSHYHPPVVKGKPWAWYGAVSSDPKAAYSFAYHSSSTPESRHLDVNHKEIGKLLGYPDCCQHFFNTVWRAGYVDPIWQSACNCKPENIKKKTDTTIRLKSLTPYQTVSMLRYINVRVTPHIPCALDCEPSVQMAKDWIQLARDIHIDGIEDLLEIMQFPIEWDCLKGIAYISTPIFKVETNSVACYPRYTVQKEGTMYPADAPEGLKFPWNESWKHLGIQQGCK